MLRNPDATCETCPYWYNILKVCRKNAPKPWGGRNKSVDRMSKGYPVVIDAGDSLIEPSRKATDWCGEHPDFFDTVEDIEQFERYRGEEESTDDEKT